MLGKFFVIAVALFAALTASPAVADTVPFPAGKIDDVALSRDELVAIYRSAAEWPWGSKEGLWRAASAGRTGGNELTCPSEGGGEDHVSFHETAVAIRSWVSPSDEGGPGSPSIDVAVYPDARAAADVFACDARNMGADRVYFSSVTGPDFVRWRGNPTPGLPPVGAEHFDSGAARLVGNVIVKAEVRDAKATEAWARPDSLASALVGGAGRHVRQG